MSSQWLDTKSVSECFFWHNKGVSFLEVALWSSLCWVAFPLFWLHAGILGSPPFSLYQSILQSLLQIRTFIVHKKWQMIKLSLKLAQSILFLFAVFWKKRKLRGCHYLYLAMMGNCEHSRYYHKHAGILVFQQNLLDSIYMHLRKGNIPFLVNSHLVIPCIPG